MAGKKKAITLPKSSNAVDLTKRIRELQAKIESDRQGIEKLNKDILERDSIIKRQQDQLRRLTMGINAIKNVTDIL